MKSQITLLSTIAALLLSATHAFAAITIEIYENGADLIMETSGGTLDLTDATSTSPGSGFGAGITSTPAVRAGGATGSSNAYVEHTISTGVAYSGDSLTGTFLGSDSVQTSGDFFGVAASFDSVYVPIASASVSISPSEITFDNTSLADIGWVTGNTGTWSWGSGSHADSITLTAVPEPSAYAALLGLVALGLVATRRRRS